MALGKRLKNIYVSARKKNHAARLRTIRASIQGPPERDASSISSKTSIALIAEKARPNVIEIKNGTSFKIENVEPDTLDASTRPSASRNSLGDERAVQEQCEGSAESHASNEEPRELDDQDIRDNHYIGFTGKNLRGLTEGPSRIVRASDGLKTCPALLLTLDLCERVRSAVQAQRELARLQEWRTDRMEVICNFCMKIGTEMSSHEARLIGLEEAEERDEPRIAALREQLNVLQQMRDEADDELLQDRNLVESKVSSVRAYHEDVIVCLEDAFIYANLVEEEEQQPRVELDRRDLKQEYVAFRRRLEELDEDEPVTPLDMRSNTFPKLPSETEEERENGRLTRAFHMARGRLRYAQQAFDNKEIWMERDRETNNKAFERGEDIEFATPEEFDLHWLKRGQELTRELMAAEKAFSVAQANVREAGIDPYRPDSSSGSSEQSARAEERPRDGVDSFTDPFFANPEPRERPKDRDGMDAHDDYVATVLRPKIIKWLDGISEPLSPSCSAEAPDVDEWEAGEVEIGDSISAVAVGEYRKRIDKWQESLDID